MEPFSGARARFEEMLAWLEGPDAVVLSHSELEDRIGDEGREVMRLALQGHFDVRAHLEGRLAVVEGADGVGRRAVEAGHRRGLTSVFGEVDVRRLAYRRRGQPNLCPADALANMPEESYSHGLRRLAAVEATRGSYAEAVGAITRATGVRVPKRQVEELARRQAVDFDAFYAQRKPQAAASTELLVLSVDAKGVVVRPDSLRPATEKAAAASSTKLKGRLSKGEKANRKRMAEVGAVYDLVPAPRTPAEVMAAAADKAVPAPKAANKWLTASIREEAATVVTQVFDEAHRRDPERCRTWVALVDGNRHQIDCIKAQAKARDVTVVILIDVIHVLEYLWKGAWSFFAEGDPSAEAWVHGRALAILAGETLSVASGIRRRATAAKLDPGARKGADAAAGYLTAKAAYLDYPTALAEGWPIATGVIEGACRHIVKDRLDLTGARWGLDGAETVLKLRALRANGDFDEYHRFHQQEERRRVHEARYAGGLIPAAA